MEIIKNIGLIFQPQKQLWWQQSHIQNPFPVQISEHVFRIYFAARDNLNISRAGWFDLDMTNPLGVKLFSPDPVLDIGQLGAFDDCGAMPHSIIKQNDEYVLYYTGWSKAVSVPFTFYIGAAKSKSLDNKFERVSYAPILGRNFFDPLLTCAPHVSIHENKMIMYYISGIKWEKDKNSNNIKHYYTAKYAHSIDGINWETNDKIVIELQEDEYAIARPVLFFNNSQYELWFSYRGGNNTYRIGKLTSPNLENWKREKVELPLGEPNSWNSEMVCYAYPFLYKNEVYILYNGNSYGATGVGLAKSINK